MLRGSRGVGEAGKKNYSVSRFTERNIAARATAEKAGFVKQAAYRWRKQLTQGEIAAIQLCCGKLIEKAGYQTESIQPRDLLVVARLWIGLPFAFTKAVVANRDRMSNIFNYVLERLSLGT